MLMLRKYNWTEWKWLFSRHLSPASSIFVPGQISCPYMNVQLNVMSWGAKYSSGSTLFHHQCEQSHTKQSVVASECKALVYVFQKGATANLLMGTRKLDFHYLLLGDVELLVAFGLSSSRVKWRSLCLPSGRTLRRTWRGSTITSQTYGSSLLAAMQQWRRYTHKDTDIRTSKAAPT